MLRAKDIGVVALDTKTTSADPMTAVLCGFSLAVADNEACYVPIGHRDGDTQGGNDLFAPEAKLCADQISEKAALAALQPVLEDPSVLKVGQDLKYHWQIFARRGIEIHPYDDTMLMSYVLDAGRGKHNMDDLAEAWLGHQSIRAEQVTGTGKAHVPFDRVTIEKASEHAAEAADIVLRLWKVLKARLAAEHVATVYATLEQPLISVLGRMERRGISIDRQVLSRLSGEFGQKQAGLEDEISKLAGQPLNPGSPKQLGDVLFGTMGLPGGTKTKTGQWATGARALEELAEQGHELPRKILDWRQVSKLRSTYTDALPDYVNAETHRVHTSYALAATTTGRLSSSEPNLQNIPVRTEEGRKIRRAFIAEPGTKLVSADYSQIELRLLAEVAEVPALRKAFRDGLDIHAMTASEMFGVPVKDMPGEVRRRAKAINFGIIYGISAFGLANQLAIPREEAGAYIKKYFERFPGIRDYMEETKAFAKKNGYVLTLVRAEVPLPRHHGRQSVAPRLQRARRDQRAAARLGRRHHPPRHGADRAGADQGEAQRQDAAPGARRADLRGARGRGREDAAGRQAGDGRRADAGGVAVGAVAGRRPRRAQLGRGALTRAQTHCRRQGRDRRLCYLTATTATASTSSNASGRASFEISSAVLAGGVPVMYLLRTSRNCGRFEMLGHVDVELDHVLEAGADRGQRRLEILEHLRRLRREIARLADALAGRVVAELAGDIDGAARTGHLDHMACSRRACRCRPDWRISDATGQPAPARAARRPRSPPERRRPSARGGGTTRLAIDDNDNDLCSNSMMCLPLDRGASDRAASQA